MTSSCQISPSVSPPLTLASKRKPQASGRQPYEGWIHTAFNKAKLSIPCFGFIRVTLSCASSRNLSTYPAALTAWAGSACISLGSVVVVSLLYLSNIFISDALQERMSVSADKQDVQTSGYSVGLCTAACCPCHLKKRLNMFEIAQLNL